MEFRSKLGGYLRESRGYPGSIILELVTTLDFFIGRSTSPKVASNIPKCPQNGILSGRIAKIWDRNGILVRQNLKSIF